MPPTTPRLPPAQPSTALGSSAAISGGGGAAATDFSYGLTAETSAVPFTVKILRLKSVEAIECPATASVCGGSLRDLDFMRHAPAHDFFAVVDLVTRELGSEQKLDTCTTGLSTVLEMGSKTPGRGILSREWNEVLTFLQQISDLPPDAFLNISIFDTVGPSQKVLVGSARLSLFEDNGCVLRRGKYRLPLSTAEEKNSSNSPSTHKKILQLQSSILQKEKMVKLLEIGDIRAIPWQDEMAIRNLGILEEDLLCLSRVPCLYIELPIFDFVVIYSEEEGTEKLRNNDSRFLYDPEIDRENLVEIKNRHLARNHHEIRNVSSSILLNVAKPDSKTRIELDKIIARGPSISEKSATMSAQEKDLVWNFRHYLSRNRKALVIFVRAVLWSDPVEADLASQMLETWQEPELGDILELLGPEFDHASVRNYAIDRVMQADESDLALYLPQLVQAIKSDENFSVMEFGQQEQSGELSQQPLLSQCLIHRAIGSEIVGILLHWYLNAETHDKMYSVMYTRVLKQLMFAIGQSPHGSSERVDLINRQRNLIEHLFNAVKQIKLMKETHARRLDKLFAILSDPNSGLSKFPPLPFPLDPTVKIVGVLPLQSYIFKSTQSPVKIVFTTDTGQEYHAIFKHGDDLRQDQLTIQLINVMDRLLLKDNLDLKLTPYKVLATGAQEGLVQFVDSYALAKVLSGTSTIQNFLKKYNLDDSASTPYSITPAAMDAYLRSCAGYCVITHLLGVGDRHLDNLMLTRDGRMFHIDFGFILGRDPKPFPPPMKLCKEMVEGMGGSQSPQFREFLNYCYVAYTILRKHTNLITNLLLLMIDAQIPDLAIGPKRIVEKMMEKFKPEMCDEAAIRHFGGLISESVSALFPVVIETIHKWAQYWRH